MPLLLRYKNISVNGGRKMTISRFKIFLLIFICISCSTPPVIVEKTKPVEIITPPEIISEPPIIKSSETSNLEKFFKRSEKDSMKAGSVLQKHKIIQHLTHLRRMDSGGKKYYLLEKDDITRMINSVTEGIYLDYILINKYGDIIYTNRNEELFGVNINTGFDRSPLQKCFANRSGVFFEDVSFLAPSSRIYSLYLSTPVFVEERFHGVLILQIDIKKISELLDPGTEVFSRDGIIRVASLEERIFSRYSGLAVIKMNDLDANGATSYIFSDNKLKFTKFRFKEIDWILMKKESLN